MPKRLAKTAGKPVPKVSRASRPEYPWATWMALGKDGMGQAFEVTQGQEFLIAPNDFVNTLHVKCARNWDGIKVTTSRDGKIVRFQFYDPKRVGKLVTDK